MPLTPRASRRDETLRVERSRARRIRGRAPRKAGCARAGTRETGEGEGGLGARARGGAGGDREQAHEANLRFARGEGLAPARARGAAPAGGVAAQRQDSTAQGEGAAGKHARTRRGEHRQQAADADAGAVPAQPDPPEAARAGVGLADAFGGVRVGRQRGRGRLGVPEWPRRRAPARPERETAGGPRRLPRRCVRLRALGARALGAGHVRAASRGAGASGAPARRAPGRAAGAALWREG